MLKITQTKSLVGDSRLPTFGYSRDPAVNSSLQYDGELIIDPVVDELMVKEPKIRGPNYSE